ncbi:MAG TPA: hypothetical protein VF469_35895, partial [Kofleriaceae bacterium]
MRGSFVLACAIGAESLGFRKRHAVICQAAAWPQTGHSRAFFPDPDVFCLPARDSPRSSPQSKVESDLDASARRVHNRRDMRQFRLAVLLSWLAAAGCYNDAPPQSTLPEPQYVSGPPGGAMDPGYGYGAYRGGPSTGSVASAAPGAPGDPAAAGDDDDDDSDAQAPAPPAAPIEAPPAPSVAAGPAVPAPGEASEPG